MSSSSVMSGISSPSTLQPDEPNESTRLMSRDEVSRIVKHLYSLARGGGDVVISLTNWWAGELRWARNRVDLASDRRDVILRVGRRIGTGWNWCDTNQVDDVSLAAVMHAAERTAKQMGSRRRMVYDGVNMEVPELPIPQATMWSDATYQVSAAQRGALAQLLSQEAEAKGMLAAGYLQMRAGGTARLEHRALPTSYVALQGEGWPKETVRYDQYSQAQCSMTVRHPKGIGSGWAGLSNYDWKSIDAPTLAKRALDKCLASLNPVAIEPGRYTVIMEPQAVCGLMDCLFRSQAMIREYSEHTGPFFRDVDPTFRVGRSKLGLQVIDERISVTHDPSDPQLGVVPFPDMTPITWFEHGVLKTLNYGRTYALSMLHENHMTLGHVAYRMSGGTTSIDEMIATTKRGLLITRFSNLLELDVDSNLVTGVTRDGLWLIERGKISKAVKNMRITESPLFVFNQVESLGVPVPVFRPVESMYWRDALSPAIVPPIKSRDFSFTSMVDAI